MPVWLSSCSIGVNNFFVIIITILITLIFLIIIILINVQLNNLSSQFFLMMMIIILIITIMIILINIQVNNFSNQSSPLFFSSFTGSNRIIASSTPMANMFYMLFPLSFHTPPLSAHSSSPDKSDKRRKLVFFTSAGPELFHRAVSLLYGSSSITAFVQGKTKITMLMSILLNNDNGSNIL